MRGEEVGGADLPGGGGAERMIRIIGVDSQAKSQREFKSDSQLVFYCDFRPFDASHLLSYRPPDDSIRTIFDIRCYSHSGTIAEMNAVIMHMRLKGPVELPGIRRSGAPMIALPDEKFTKIHSEVGLYFGSDFIDVDLGHKGIAHECIVDGDNYFVVTREGGLLGVRISALPTKEVRACESTFDFFTRRRDE
jgi:hypothetical protein